MDVITYACYKNAKLNFDFDRREKEQPVQKRVFKPNDRRAEEATGKQSIFRGKVFDYILIVVL